MTATKDALHDRLLAIALKLPGAYEDRPWGSVHCKVDGKIFVGWGRLEDGSMSIGIRVDKWQQMALVDNDPRFTIAKYVGKHGGIDMNLGPKPDWAEVERLIVQSYRIIAPKRRVKELEALAGARADGGAKAEARRKPATRRSLKTSKA